MIKFVDESGSINYCFCTVLVSCAVLYSFMVKLYAYTFLVNKKVCSHNVHHLVLWPGFRTYEFQCLMIVTWMPTEFMIQHLFKCIFKLGPRAVNMLRAPRCLNPALPICQQLARNQGRRGGFRLSWKIFRPTRKNVLDTVWNIWASLRRLSPPWCPKLVMDLVSRHGIFFLMCSSRFSCSTLGFLSAASLLYCRCIWPEFMISVIAATTHTVFSQHSRTTTFTSLRS